MSRRLPSDPKRIGHPSLKRNPDGRFTKGTGGRAKGIVDVRVTVGMETARALAGKAVDVVEKLLTGPHPRVRLEAAKVILAYAWGLPRQSIDISGGAFSEVAAALADALKAAREARATAALVAPAAPALEAPVIDAEPIEAPECKDKTLPEIGPEVPHG